jgi:HK97 family phage major capsid protein
MTLKELRQQRSVKATRGKAALAELNTLSAVAEPTDAQKASITALNAEIDELETAVTGLDAQIEAEEKTARRGALFATASHGGGARAAFGQSARTVSEPDPVRQGGFKALSEFALAVRNAQVGVAVDPRLLGVVDGDGREAAATNFQQNQGTAGEGFLVPTTYREAIWDLTFNEPDLLSFVTPEPTMGNTVKIAKDETTPWGGQGVVAGWRGEGAQLAASKMAMSGMIVELHELTAFVLATQEVLDDGPRLQDRLTRQASKAISWTASDAIAWGDGNGKPLGFMNSPALVTVAAEAGQAVDTLAVKNVLKMNARVLRAGGQRPLFLANSDIDPELGTLTIGDSPAFLPNNQPLTSPFEGTLRGKPLLYTEHCTALGDLGDIMLCDFSGYYCATKQGGGIDFAASIHLYFDQNIQAFRWIFRFGGQPFLSAPVARAKAGAQTKSHFVTLAAR